MPHSRRLLLPRHGVFGLGLVGTRRLSRTRRFGGETFTLRTSVSTKTQANRIADRVRTLDRRKARVVDIGGRFQVYEGPRLNS